MTEQIPEKKSMTLRAREAWKWSLLLRITQSNTSFFSPLTSQEITKMLVMILWGLEWIEMDLWHSEG